MKIGVSSSCFYPAHTEEGIRELNRLGIRQIELFLNAFQELEKNYADTLRRQLVDAGIEVVSFHPFTSGMESFFFSTAYDRRMEDGIALYRRLFETAAGYGAKIYVFHGDYKASPFPFEQYCENFARLAEVGAEYGVTLCQENVVRCRCGSLEKIRRMRQLLGDRAHFVLDLKQAVQSGENVFEMCSEMGPALAHIHISDSTPDRDCLPPGKGTFDFARFFSLLTELSYQEAAILELYRGNFEDPAELKQAVLYLEQFMK